VSVAEVEPLDEHADSFFIRMLSSMQTVEPAILGAPHELQPLDARAYQEALRTVVLAAIDVGHVVIVGRGGQALLKDRRDVLHARVVAPLDMRVEYVARREALTHERALQRVQQKDRDREQYMMSAHHCRVSDAHNYDIVVNTAVFDLDAAVDMLWRALAAKAQRLDVPATALGPGMGLAEYAGQTADLHPPEV